MTIKMANTSSEGFVSSASRRAAASGRAFRAYQTKDVDQLYRELLHKRYQRICFFQRCNYNSGAIDRTS